MPLSSPASAPHRAICRLQRLRSPLSRVAYALPTGAAHLLVLEAGTVHLRRGEQRGAEHPAPRLMWWTEAEARELIASAGSRGLLVSIPLGSLTQALPATPIGDQMRRTLSQDLSVSAEGAAALTDLLEGLAREASAAEPGADLAQMQYLTLVLLTLWRVARTDLVVLGRAPQGLSERFVLLAGQRAREHWTVDRYAAELRVSRDRLGSAVKRTTGLSPQAYLHRLLTREAMELLANTGMPVSQIAFRLGFGDPAYFTRFFRRQADQTPAAFRKAHRKPGATQPLSFAAWP